MAVFRVEGRDNFEFREMRHVFRGLIARRELGLVWPRGWRYERSLSRRVRLHKSLRRRGFLHRLVPIGHLEVT